MGGERQHTRCTLVYYTILFRPGQINDIFSTLNVKILKILNKCTIHVLILLLSIQVQFQSIFIQVLRGDVPLSTGLF